MPFISLPSSRSSIIGSVTISPISTEGEHQYNIAGTYNWTAPAGVSLVSVVAIGGGAGGSGGWGPGGAGGGLAYKNNISVTPGQSYTVVVGSGGAGAVDDGDNSIWSMAVGSNGGESYFISTSTIRASGGTAGQTTSPYPSVGGTNLAGDGGGSGGLSETSGSGYHWAGGGAGGYSGTGGRSGSSGSAYTGWSGQNYSGNPGAGGGGGAGGMLTDHKPPGGGGGVGFFGEGTSGSGGNGYITAVTGTNGGGGGSGGSDGSHSSFVTYDPGAAGGNYGGGGGCGYTTGGAGGVGAVRIIWGTSTRSFPSTNVNLASSNGNVSTN